MKYLNFLMHPFVLVLGFLFMIMDGKDAGSVYVIYLLWALTNFQAYVILAVLGIFLLMFSYYRYGRTFKFMIEPLLNLAGLFFLFISMVVFYFEFKDIFGLEPFTSTGSLLTIGLFLVLSVSFIFYNVASAIRESGGGRMAVK